MEATLTDTSSIKTFSRLATCLSKLGHHLQLTPQQTTPPTLTIRTINDAQSAYANFILHPTFFSSLHLPPSASPVKISTRALQPILKSPQTTRILRFRSTQSRLIITIHTRSALVKTFRLPIIDGRIGRTLFDRSACTSLLHASPRFLTDLLQNFHAKLDELTITPGPSSLTLSSFVDDPSNPANIMLRTELLVNIHEFEQYTHSKPGNISLTIFCRYFRAVLEFCESLDKPLHLYYDVPGAPVLFQVSVAAPGAAPSIEAQFVFASRHVPDGDPVSQTRAARLSAPFEGTNSLRASDIAPMPDSHLSQQLPVQPPPVASIPPVLPVISPHPPSSIPVSPMRMDPMVDAGPRSQRQSEETFGESIVGGTAPEEEDDDDDDDFVDATPPP